MKHSGEDISEGVHSVICDPSYNTLQIVQLSDSERERLVLNDMSRFVEFLPTLVDLDAHVHMFCFALQSKTRYDLLIGDVEGVVKHKQVLESEEGATQTTTFLKPRRDRCIKCGHQGSSAVTLE